MVLKFRFSVLHLDQVEFSEMCPFGVEILVNRDIRTAGKEEVIVDGNRQMCGRVVDMDHSLEKKRVGGVTRRTFHRESRSIYCVVCQPFTDEMIVALQTAIKSDLGCAKRASRKNNFCPIRRDFHGSVTARQSDSQC